MKSKIVSFFSTDSVKNKIVTGTLSEGQLFIYFYLILMFDTITFVQQWLSIARKTPTIVDLVNIWGLLIINAIGFIVVFLANGGTKGKNFLSKYFSLSFTVGFKYCLGMIILQAIPAFIFHLTPAYEIGIFIIFNSLMVANISFQVYQTRKFNFVENNP